MPRQSRIDAPGALHHVIIRGINRERIFYDHQDRFNFLKRLGDLTKKSNTGCYAWALLDNHAHLLLRTGSFPIATLMRRLLTGYVLNFNRRHNRWGHLFQNRYRSILCQEEAYLLELVRYIHLNPLRAKLVSDMGQLDRYAFSGHSAVMGKQKSDWQNIKYVLSQFGKQLSLARRQYRRFVEKGIGLGRRKELVGGGLIRSLGGWPEVKALRRKQAFMKGDERILGDSGFVENVLACAEEAMVRKYQLKAMGLDLEAIAGRVADHFDMKAEEVWSAGKNRKLVKARSLLCYWAVRELDISMTELAQRLKLSVTAVSNSVSRGEDLAKASGYFLELS